jgi:hypothetical protein
VKFTATQAARLAYEELRRPLEPRRRHPVHFGLGLLLLLVMGAGLTMLILIELSGWLGGPRSALPALAATAVWLTVAWLAVLAVPRRRWALVTAVIAAAVLVELLLVALHGLSPQPAGTPAATPDHGSTVFGVLTGALILVLTAGAAVLMAHLESPSLLQARQRWHPARAAYEKVAATHQTDAETAAVAIEAWLGLVRARVAEIAAGDERLVHDTVALAAVLVERDRHELPPPGNPAGPAAPVSGSGLRRLVSSRPETTAEGRGHEPRHLHQRISRARDDIKALLWAIIRRDELY